MLGRLFSARERKAPSRWLLPARMHHNAAPSESGTPKYEAMRHPSPVNSTIAWRNSTNATSGISFTAMLSPLLNVFSICSALI